MDIKTVAVIGAGISGVCTAAHLLKVGLKVVVFERSSVAGGVWHFDKRQAVDAPFPNLKPSSGDYAKVPNGQYAYQTPPKTPEPVNKRDIINAESVNALDLDAFNEDIAIRHAPPGPCYAGLKNNVSLSQMKTSLASWPEGLEDFVNQQHLEEYIQDIAQRHGVNGVTEFNTRVEEVTKLEGKWSVRTTTLRDAKEDQVRLLRLEERHWDFDSVVVASGHYNMPRVPEIPGLSEWKRRFPDRVWHSKRYRSPIQFKDKRILLIGAGVSSNDISKEAEGIARKIYQSSRGGDLDLPPSMLPPSATRIGGIKALVLDDSTSAYDNSSGYLPGYVELTNGSRLCGVDEVVVATGYITSYPFLPQYHADDRQAEEAEETDLVTADGEMVHNLHKDIFFIPDPTLAFVGAPYHISTFSLFDFQAQLIARVFKGLAEMPSREQMRQEYEERVAERGLGRDFHSLRAEGQELLYVQDLVDWANEVPSPDVEPMEGHSEVFHAAYKVQRERLKALGRRLEKGGGESFEHIVVEGC